jgi:uncharacterized protein (DUF1501 family)
MSITRNDRRDFLKRTGLAIAAGGAAGFIPQLRLIETAAAQTVSCTGYKALVCIYLAGGNDSWNMLVPSDNTRYPLYQAARAGLEIPQASLLGLSSTTLAAGQYGVHPQMAGVQSLFSQEKLAFITNMGTLTRPLTKTTYNNNSVPKPPQLYSHNDQETLWNLGKTDPQAPYGWGGLVADQVNQCNTNAQLSACISIGGNNRFQVGNEVFSYQMSTGGTTSLQGYDNGNLLPTAMRPAVTSALNDLLAASYTNILTNESAKVQKRARDLDVLIRDQLATNGVLTTVFPVGTGATYNNLADQLRMVARMIKIRSSLGQSRQVFYVRLGGFDTHNSQNTDQPVLLGKVSAAMAAFYDCMNTELGIGNDVMAFTMSEFSRTLNTNGDGSDHAYGGNHMVMGGSVLGGKIYGTFPEVRLDGPDSLSRGQMIPTSGVEQMGVTCAKFMGVTDTAVLNSIFPNPATLQTH